MRYSHRFALLGTVLLGVLCLATPTQTEATILWGHPYAMQINTATDFGWVHMWNNNASPPYVGTGTLNPISTPAGHKNTWDMMVLGMVNKKLNIVWTSAGPNSNVNDQSTGAITAAVTTIF